MFLNLAAAGGELKPQVIVTEKKKQTNKQWCQVHVKYQCLGGWEKTTVIVTVTITVTVSKNPGAHKKETLLCFFIELSRQPFDSVHRTLQ